MKLIKYIIVSALIFSAMSCEIEDLPNPNGSSIEGFSQDASKSELQTLVTGMEDLLRQEIGFYYDVTSIVGREYWFFTGSDPRYTGEVLGKGEATLDRAGFYGSRPYLGRYKTIKNANVMINAVDNSTQITAEEAQGYLGYAKTMQAYEYHLALNLQYNNGIRIDVSDPDNLGSFLDYDPALAAIAALLETAVEHLDKAGTAFPFTLSSAMDGFDNPASFVTFNRALAARIALYQGNKGAALTFLASSFIDMSGDLNVGPARFYSTSGGDFSNNLFRQLDQADAIIAHPTFVSDTLANDVRISKIVERTSPLTLDGLTGSHDVFVYKSLDDFVSYIRNEELILILAEANIGTDNDMVITALNAVRQANNLDDYAGGTSDAEVFQELMLQRRYSLFGEGHRWVDMRRWGLLGDLPIDRAGDDVWEQMPRPISEG
jgi:hypothetical protein